MSRREKRDLAELVAVAQDTANELANVADLLNSVLGARTILGLGRGQQSSIVDAIRRIDAVRIALNAEIDRLEPSAGYLAGLARASRAALFTVTQASVIITGAANLPAAVETATNATIALTEMADETAAEEVPPLQDPVRVPVRRNEFGPVVDVMLASVVQEVMVDVGSNHSFIDLEWITEHAPQLSPVMDDVAFDAMKLGVGGQESAVLVTEIELPVTFTSADDLSTRPIGFLAVMGWDDSPLQTIGSHALLGSNAVDALALVFE